jgi:hypothetical protein
MPRRVADSARDCHRGQQEYCEECPDQRRLVRRDPALRDNGALPAAFQRVAGDLLYSSMRDGFTVDGQVRPVRPVDYAWKGAGDCEDMTSR